MLLIVFSLQKQEAKYSENICRIAAHINKEKARLDQLANTTQRLCKSMQFNAHTHLYSETNTLAACAKKHHLISPDIKVSSPEIIYKEKTVRLQKIPVRMNFLLTKDEHFWKFLNNLQELFPSSILFHFLSIKRIFSKEHELIFLQGSFHFDWCNVLLESERP
jgi:hypothetical protein